MQNQRMSKIPGLFCSASWYFVQTCTLLRCPVSFSNNINNNNSNNDIHEFNVILIICNNVASVMKSVLLI